MTAGFKIKAVTTPERDIHSRKEVITMKWYMVIAQVNGRDFLTKVQANSLMGAEHIILDRGVCGKHTYGVTACTAYDESTMKYDTFYMNALNANPIDLGMLVEIIEKRNAEIIAKDEAEKRIEEIEKQMKQLQDELKANKKVLGL